MVFLLFEIGNRTEIQQIVYPYKTRELYGSNRKNTKFLFIIIVLQNIVAKTVPNVQQTRAQLL